MCVRALSQRLALGAALVSSVACVHATLGRVTPAQATTRYHAIFVDHDGRPLAPSVETSAKLMDSVAYGQYLHVLLDSVRASGKHTVLLWIHGGLVSLADGLNVTERVTREMAADSTQRDVYPIGVDWESNLTSAYREHLLSVRQGRRETRPLAILLTTPFYFIADVGRALTRAPVVWFGQASRFVENDHPERVRRAESRLETAMNAALDSSTGAHPGAIALSIGRYNGTNMESFLHYATLPFLPFKMLGTFLIDGVGVPGWQVMHRRTKTMYRSPGEWRAIERSASYLPATGGLSILLDSLVALTAGDSGQRYSVTLVGHSMGAIVASEALRTHPRLPVSSVVFLAGAASIREWGDAVLPYLESHPTTRFYNVTLHPVAERREFYLAHLAPDGSLLEWIDGYIASPETELDRVIGIWNNMVMATRIIPDSVRSQVQLKAFGYRDGVGYGASGLEPHRHGDFTDPGVPFWRCDFWQPTGTTAECVGH